MNPLSEVLRSKRANDSRGLQKALREIDNRDLALSLLNIDEKEREIIYRNMTKHAVMGLKKDIEYLNYAKNTINERRIIDAQEMISEILIKFTREFEKPVTKPEDIPFPEINFDTYDEIIKTFERISDYALKYGLVALDGIQDTVDNVMFQKGMELITDGTDPILVDEFLENYKKSMMHRYETKLNMIAAGIKDIQIGMPPFIISEKLNSLKS